MGISLLGGNATSESTATVSAFADTAGTVVVYWGRTDAGPTPVGWEHSQNLGAKPSSQIDVNLINLVDETIYFYTFSIDDGSGATWPSPFTPLFRNRFQTQAYPQKTPGLSVSPAGFPVGALVGPWQEGICPKFITRRFRQSVINCYSVGNSRIQCTTHTTSVGTYTATTRWTSSDPRTVAYQPAPVGGQIQGDDAMGISLTPAQFDLAVAADGQLWFMRKGGWKFSFNVNVNGAFFNSDPGAGGVQGGPYTVTVYLVPYSTQGRPKRAQPPITFTTQVGSGGAAFIKTFRLMVDCFWLMTTTVTVWASQTNQVGHPPVTNVDIVNLDITGDRQP